jgi:IS5 family transposase
VTSAVEYVTANLADVRENKHKTLRRMCRNLLGVVQDDLVTDEHGVIQIAHRTTSARLISFTDPDAQHFRKSKSKVCSGYKLHVLGDAASGLVIALSVTPGGVHDSTQAHPLIERAKTLYADIRKVLGDAAYGGMPVRLEVRDRDQVEILAPPAAESREEGLGKKDFTIDFERMVATCPGGVASSGWTLNKQGDDRAVAFHWAKGSANACACPDKCPVHSGKRHSLQLHPNEKELRETRAEWEKPETRADYRKRSRGERLIREMTRRGARRACAWGIENARLQALCSGGVNNLLVLARHLAAQLPATQRTRAKRVA